MSYLDLTIKEIHDAIISGHLNYHELVREAINRAKESNLNGFVTILEEADKIELDENKKSNLLYGIPYGCKDNFSTKNVLSTGCSNILSGYKPVFNATVVNKLEDNGAVMIGKNTMDELAMGGTGLNSNTGFVHNPYDFDRIPGGSSSGGAVAVASGIVPFAIGSDTGDSVRKPAAYCGIVGFKPTYGRISRFGLFPFAQSMDTVAWFTRSVEDSSYLLEALQGHDEYDATCSIKNYDSIKLTGNLKGKTFGIIRGVDKALKNEQIIDNYNSLKEKLNEAGVEVKRFDVDFKLLRAIYSVYIVISCAEATSNNANLDGIKFGLHEDGATCDEQMLNTRTKGFGEFIKHRFILGSYALSRDNQEKVFLRAQRVRRLLVNEMHRILGECDAILMPCSDHVAPLISDTNSVLSTSLDQDNLTIENCLALANFSGLPSITIPCGFVDGMPIGINLMTELFEDEKLLDIAYGVESLLGIKNNIKKEDK